MANTWTSCWRVVIRADSIYASLKEMKIKSSVQ